MLPRMQLRVVLASLVLAVASCKGSSTPPATGSGSGAGDGYQAQGKKPEGATRPTPPPTLALLPVGSVAPAIALPDAKGAMWTLADALTKWKRVVIVFYRGDW